MRVFIRYLLLVVLTGLYGNLYAQLSPSIIQGRVLTRDHSSAEAATIVLLKYKDSAIVNSAVINKTGAFQFVNLPPDSYLLLVSKVGYDKYYSGPYKVSAGQVMVADDVVLNPAANVLKEVSVVASRPDVEVRPGKIILNLPNSLIAAGNSAFDVLRQAPGVRVDNNENISIVGHQSALITIDGKPTNLTGEDLAGILKGMQTNTIDRIELITAGSGKYDAAAGGIINIILKKGKNYGANATVTASAGYGKYYKSNVGAVFNYRSEKINVFGNYNFTDNKTFHDYNTERVINFDNVLSNYNVDYNSTQKSYNHAFNLGTDYFISANHTIGFLVNGTVRTDDFVKNDKLNIYNQSVLDSTIIANSNVHRKYTTLNYNLNYRGKLDEKGSTLSADLNYSTYDRNSAEYITNDFYNASGSLYRDSLLENLSPSNIHIWLSKIDYSNVMSKTSKLEAGLKYSDVTSNNDLIFGPMVNGVYQSDPRFSNHFVYTENVNAAYINYEGKFNKFGVTASLRAGQTIAKGNTINDDHVVNYNYLDFFPHVLLTYSQNEKNDFSLTYSRGIQRPAYEDLNPFLYYSDLYDYRAGNPNLKPQYSNTVELSYTYNKTYVVTLYSSIISDAYDFPYYEQNDTTKVNITTHKNLGKIYNYGARFFVPVTFTSWWNASFNVDASYQRYVVYPVNGTLNKGTQDIIFSGLQNFAISKTVSAEISGNYESPNFYGINQLKANYSVNAAIGKQLFNKMGSIKLNVSDIFNTKRDRAQTNYENIDLTATDKRESQVARLVFTYRFGKTSIKGTPAHNPGTEEEQKRTKSSIGN